MVPATSAGRNRGRVARTLGAAALSRILGVLPAFLVGSLSVLLREDLGLTETQLGTAVSVFFASSALTSVLGGRVSERIGARRAMIAAAAGSGAALLGVATIARDWLSLSALLAVAGVANALSQPATNLALAEGIAPARQGLAFGIKQAANPAATMVAGSAVPLLGLTVGWRWAFAGAALAAVAFRFAAPPSAQGGRVRSPVRPRGAPDAALILLAVGAALGTAAATAMGAFYVESAVRHGISAAVAGLWLALGGLAGISARIGWGWLADRRDGGNLVTVSWLQVAGAPALVLLGYAVSVPVLALATLPAYALGWGWNGLFHLAVVRQHRAAPAAATGVVSSGLYAGGMVGPLSFGFAAQHSSFAVAWGLAGAALLAAAVTMRVGRRRLLVQHARRAAPG
jgi:predicted MFS family arabinose efflux permease